MLRAGALAWGAEEPGLPQCGEKAITGGLKSHSSASLPAAGATGHRETRSSQGSVAQRDNRHKSKQEGFRLNRRNIFSL